MPSGCLLVRLFNHLSVCLLSSPKVCSETVGWLTTEIPGWSSLSAPAYLPENY